MLGIAVALGAVFHFWGRQRDLEAYVPEFIAFALGAGALYLAGVYLVERFTLGVTALLVILGGAVVFRLFLLPLSPALSEDVYRYQWEGRVQRLHLNPYTVFPALPDLRWLQDPKHPLETGRTTSTVYPPFSEIAFSWVEMVPGYKRLFTGLDLASLCVLLLTLAALKQPLHRALTYAWNPTVIVSFAMCGHHDSLAVFTLLVANWAIITHRRTLSFALLALSFLSKFFPLLLLPVFLKGSVGANLVFAPRGDHKDRPYKAAMPIWVYAGIFGAVAIIGYFPYLSAGGNLFRGLSEYATGWEANDSAFHVLLLAGNSKAQAELVGAVLVLSLVAYAVRKRMEPLQASFLLTAGLVLLSPNAFPWYFTWSIPFLCFYPSVPWLLMSVTGVLGYAPVATYAAGQPYKHSPFILALEYVPIYVWLAYEGWKSGVGSRQFVETRT